jgi:hypothetical protein
MLRPWQFGVEPSGTGRGAPLRQKIRRTQPTNQRNPRSPAGLWAPIAGPSSAKGAFHHSLGFQLHVPVAPHSPALKARPMKSPGPRRFSKTVVLHPNRPSWNAPLALTAVGYDVYLGLTPQVPVAPHAPALKARPMNRRVHAGFPIPLLCIQIAHHGTRRWRSRWSVMTFAWG